MRPQILLENPKELEKMSKPNMVYCHGTASKQVFYALQDQQLAGTNPEGVQNYGH